MVSGEYLLTDLDKRVLNRIQLDFPLVADPYGQLADELDVARERVHRTVATLRTKGIIRRIGASYNAARLGYATTLVAAEVRVDEIEQVAAFVNHFPEVTHNYQRDHQLNLWFTVIAPSQEHLREIIAQIGQRPGIRRIHTLPSCDIFKLKVDFRFAEARIEEPAHCPVWERYGTGDRQNLPPPVLHKPLIAQTCGDIGETLDPYGNMADKLNLERTEVLERLIAYRERGLLRRFGAILRHQAAGFSANGMTVWRVPENRIQEIGRHFAAQTYISHCYQRPPAQEWSYNLYAMMHGPDRLTVNVLCQNLARASQVSDYAVLFSLREFKKSSMAYFSEHTGSISLYA